LQPDPRLTAEQSATLTEIAAARIEAAFELKHRLQSAAEFLAAAQPPPRRQLAGDARHADQSVACRIRMRHILDARIDDAV